MCYVIESLLGAQRCAGFPSVWEGLLLSFLLASKQFEMSPNSVGCQQRETEKKIRLEATALSLTN